MIQPHPVLYSFRRCPYAMRARMALHVSEIRCELREVVLRDKPAQFLALSAKATVPVLQLPDGRVLDQSLDIIDWALHCNDPENWLLNTPSARLDSEELIQRCDGDFKHHLDRYKYSNRFADEAPHDHRTSAYAFLQVLDQRLTQSTYLHGNALSVTDVAIAPFVRQFANTDREWFNAQPLTHLNSWLEAFLQSARFVAIMTKYKPWTGEDAVTLFPDLSLKTPIAPSR